MVAALEKAPKALELKTNNKKKTKTKTKETHTLSNEAGKVMKYALGMQPRQQGRVSSSTTATRQKDLATLTPTQLQRRQVLLTAMQGGVRGGGTSRRRPRAGQNALRGAMPEQQRAKLQAGSRYQAGQVRGGVRGVPCHATPGRGAPGGGRGGKGGRVGVGADPGGRGARAAAGHAAANARVRPPSRAPSPAARAQPRRNHQGQQGRAEVRAKLRRAALRFWGSKAGGAAAIVVSQRMLAFWASPASKALRKKLSVAGAERKRQQEALLAHTLDVVPTPLAELAAGLREGWGLLPPPPPGMVYAPVDMDALVEAVVEGVAQEAEAAAAAGRPAPPATTAPARLAQRLLQVTAFIVGPWSCTAIVEWAMHVRAWGWDGRGGGRQRVPAACRGVRGRVCACGPGGRSLVLRVWGGGLQRHLGPVLPPLPCLARPCAGPKRGAWLPLPLQPLYTLPDTARPRPCPRARRRTHAAPPATPTC